MLPRMLSRLVLAAALTLAAAAKPSPPPRSSHPGKPPAVAPAATKPAPAPTSPDTAVSTRPAMPDTLVPAFWKTKAERSDYRFTADYDETIRFCKQLEAGTRW